MAGTRTPISLDQDGPLSAAAERLAREFDGIFGLATVERFLRTSHASLAESATIATHLPVLTEKFARQRLRALARVEHGENGGTPTVLFLCTHNAGRSQIALGYFHHYAGSQAVGWSGGSEPGNRVNPTAIELMREVGIDISTEYPKPWTDEVVQAADVVITMGCGDACPIFPGKRYHEWVVPDPAGLTPDEARPIRDDIEKRVRALLDEIGIPAVP